MKRALHIREGTGTRWGGTHWQRGLFLFYFIKRALIAGPLGLEGLRPLSVQSEDAVPALQVLGGLHPSPGLFRQWNTRELSFFPQSVSS